MWLLMALISPSYKQLVELLCVWEKDRQREAIQLSLLFLNDKTDFIYSWCNYWHYISPLHLIYVLLLFSHWVVWFFSTPWTAARQASLSFTSSQSLLKFMSIELMIPSNHLIFCCPLFLLPSIFRSIRIFSNEEAPGVISNYISDMCLYLKKKGPVIYFHLYLICVHGLILMLRMLNKDIM